MRAPRGEPKAPGPPSPPPAPPHHEREEPTAADSLFVGDDELLTLPGAPAPGPEAEGWLNDQTTAELLPVIGEEDEESLALDRTSVAPAPPRPFVVAALEAIRSSDFEGLDQAIERAVTDGSDPGAVGRVRAVAQLARGDLRSAKQTLAEARGRGRGDRSAEARYHLAAALLELGASQPSRAIRSALTALAISRRLSDARGEVAALHTMAACYRALGRPETASRLAPPLTPPLTSPAT